MQHIRAIGFDLFDTLITLKTLGFEEAISRLIKSLQAAHVHVDTEHFRQLYRQTARRFVEVAQQDGRETHNRFWVCAALQEAGFDLSPEDPRITAAVEAYFSAFIDHATLLPGTIEMLAVLKGHYRLGLLSNLTHAPAAQRILDKLGLRSYFDAILVSGELGYRKPHPRVFQALVEQLQVLHSQTIFVGDNWEADVQGAHQVGLRPVWITFEQAIQGPAAAAVLSPAVPRVTAWGDFLSLLEMA